VLIAWRGVILRPQVSFMTVNHEAAESDKIRVMHKVGLTDFSFPAIAAAPATEDGSLAFDQLQVSQCAAGVTLRITTPALVAAVFICIRR
jgi:hypothetical protein